MNFKEALLQMNAVFGNNKDNLIAVATIAEELSKTGDVMPAVRTVDAYYEDGVWPQRSCFPTFGTVGRITGRQTMEWFAEVKSVTLDFYE